MNQTIRLLYRWIHTQIGAICEHPKDFKRIDHGIGIDGYNKY